MPNQRLEQRLYTAILQERVPHALLLTGPAGSDAAGLACRAAAYYCTGEPDVSRLTNCPDYMQLGPNGIPVDSVRDMQAALAERSFSGRRAVVFLEAHQMNQFAQNALLKTLEEPPKGTLFLLVGDQFGLLPTIRSRCSVLRLGAEEQSAVEEGLFRQGVPREIARVAAWLSEGAPLLAKEIATQAHEAFFQEASALFFQAIQSPIPLYQQVAELLDTYPAAGQDARSKAARQRPAAVFCLQIWLRLARTMLHAAYACREPGDIAQVRQAYQVAQRFTIGQIQCIIELLLTARMRMDTANPGLTMDTLFTRLACGQTVEIKEKNK